MFEYSLSRSKRKTVALYVRNGMVEVRAPLKMPKDVIDRFVESKEKWIADKLEITNERAALRNSFFLDYGSNVLYRGNLHVIEAREGDFCGFDEGRFYMPPNLSSQRIKEASIQIYRMLAKRDLLNRTFEFAEKMSVMPASVKITNAKSRWGSCSGKKNVCFSWRLIMAEDCLIDYIIVHELAHLIELNHSERFWKIVFDAVPDYKERQAKLKLLHEKLIIEDW